LALAPGHTSTVADLLAQRGHDHDSYLRMRPDEQKMIVYLLSLGPEAWVRPMDVGGQNLTTHHRVLKRLARKGWVEQRSRRGTNGQGVARESYIYRLISKK
jgi:hypothetical protein